MKSQTFAYPRQNKGTTVNSFNEHVLPSLEAEDAVRPDVSARCWALGALFGLSEFTSRLRLYDEWVLGKKEERQQTKAMRAGVIFEEAICQVGLEERNAELASVMSPDWVFENRAVRIRGIPDRIVLIGNELTVVEIKRTTHRITDITQIPDEYILQLNTYGMLTGIKNLEFWIDTQGNFKHFQIPFNQELADETVRVVADFLDGDRPKVDGNDDVQYELRNLGERIIADTKVHFPDELVERALEHSRLGKKRKELEAQAKEIKKQEDAITLELAAAADGAELMLGDGVEFTQKRVFRKEYFVKSTEYMRRNVKIFGDLKSEQASSDDVL